jgi:cytochrome bd ubiquinol oxidase subunit I
MHLDIVLLSRIQFALTIMFHYLFPPLTIGLSALMVVMEGLFLKTRNPVYEQMARFWTGIFAVNFAMGVATGIVMEFQFGTNWAGYSKFVGDVFGSALAAEGIFAFFLESGFLSILVFGWDKVKPKVHFFATLMVCFGSIFSAVWIVIANSWQQTPVGYELVNFHGVMRCEIKDFWAVVFNPSSMPRLSHTLSGAFVLGSFFVMSVSSFYLLKGRFAEFARKSLSLGLIAAFLSSFWALMAGDTQARTVAFTQPTKLAAFEGHYHTDPHHGTGLYIFGIPNERERRVDFGLRIPDMLSFLVYFDPNKPVEGLDKTPEKDWPPVAIPFTCFHTMVALGGFFFGVTALGLFMMWRKKLFETRWLLWVYVFAVIGPFVANEVGWVAAEVGRQPWIVYHLLRTSDGVSRNLPPEHVVIGIIMFSLIYVLLLMVWVNVLHTKISHGPHELKEAAFEETTSKSLLETAAELADPAGPTLTAAPRRPESDKTMKPLTNDEAPDTKTEDAE